MAVFDRCAGRARIRPAARIVMAMALVPLLGACANMNEIGRLAGGGRVPPSLASGGPGSVGGANARPARADGQNALRTATLYWARAFAKNPRDGKAAVAYARNLKALGARRKALSVLQQAHMYNSADKAVASEYGRLALEFGQVRLAEKLLARAADPAKPDWRILSARGTILAKRGEHRAAQRLFERALALEPGRPSLLNNLALAYALGGEAEKAEKLLRKAVQSEGAAPRMRQNLALVLGLRGKFEDARRIAAVDLPPRRAETSVAYLRKMVKAAPVPSRAPKALALASKPLALAAKPAMAAASTHPRAAARLRGTARPSAGPRAARLSSKERARLADAESWSWQASINAPQ